MAKTNLRKKEREKDSRVKTETRRGSSLSQDQEQDRLMLESRQTPEVGPSQYFHAEFG